MAKHVQAVFLSFSAFLTPIVGIVTGWIALGETVTTEMLLGTAVVVVGIAIANLADTRVHSASHP
jgi:drug/metabolite transporter (DMT)-like permease